ncbi:MAG: serine/threonine protein kinase [Pirellulales bacterium]|nr:serine/threonine protein kinase [Pirellulales bacterium]
MSLDTRGDRLCDQFEAAWKSGSRPRVEDFLPLGDDQRAALLRELVALDCAYRRGAGETPLLAEYLARFPDDQVVLADGWDELCATVDPRRSADRSNLTPLRVRCPHCRESLDVVVDQSLRDLACPACANHFNLLGDAAGPELAPGAMIGHFRLVRPLGAGRFGQVWLAHDTQLDRQVAIKVPRRGLLTGDDAERFLREARAAAQLHHPGIVGVHEVGRDGAQVYIVSDYVDGPTLAERIEQRPPSVREGAHLASQLADVLHAAHQAGIVHRDVKPSNVLVDATGAPHVTDFGLAQRDAGEVTVTVEGQVFGTPAYMSPEQARGAGGTADARADVYSIGVVLYQMLTGSLPFQGNVRMQLYQVLHEEPRPPRQLNDRVLRDLECICLKAMAKEPHWRYATAHELAEDLRRFLRGEPVLARPSGWARRALLWARRPRRIVEAGWTMLVVTALQTMLALVGVVAFAGGLTTAGVRRDIALGMLAVIAVFYVPCFVLGLLTIRGSRPALWIGAGYQVLSAAIAVLHLVGVLSFYNVLVGPSDRGELLRHWVAYSAMALIAAGYYGVAMIADVASRQASPRDRGGAASS